MRPGDLRDAQLYFKNENGPALTGPSVNHLLFQHLERVEILQIYLPLLVARWNCRAHHTFTLHA